MARIPRKPKASINEQIALTEKEISELESRLKELKTQLKNLEEQKKKEEIDEIYTIIKESGKTMDEVKAFISEWAWN